MAPQAPPPRAGQTLDCPQLLKLPRELRLEIWRNTITDPSIDDLPVHITTAFVPSPCADNLSRPSPNRFHRTFESSLSKTRTHPVNLALLLVNRRTYEEALPLLYHSVTFCSPDPALTAFLSTLSDFAKAQIRSLRLVMPTPWPQATGPNWSIKCAQIARLPGLRLVTIESTSPPAHFDGALAQKRIFWPLLSIKAPKRMVPAHDVEFQVILARAADALEAEKMARKEQAEWEHVSLGEEEIARDESIPAQQHDGKKHRIDEKHQTDDEDSDWELLSTPSSSCPSPTDTPRSRTVSDSLRKRSNWADFVHDH